MSRLMLADHRHGWLPDWTYESDATGTTRTTIVAPPAGDGEPGGSKTPYVTSRTGTTRKAPRKVFTTAVEEIYGEFLIYVSSDIGAGADAAGFGEFPPVLKFYNAAGLDLGHIALFQDTPTVDFGMRIVLKGIPGTDEGSGAQSQFADLGAYLALNAWHKIDYRLKYSSTTANNVTQYVEIRADCGSAGIDTGAYTDGSVAYTTVKFGIKEVRMPDSGGLFEYYIDNLVINEISGGSADSWVCEEPGDGPFATVWPDGGSSIYPAPERLPHVINIKDVGGNKVLQRKLQDNFESIERQLLALDPDSLQSPSPYR